MLKQPENERNTVNQELVNLLQQAEHGDRLAFRSVVRMFLPRLHAMLAPLVSREEDTQDILQEVFIRVYRSLAQLKNKQAFKSWLYRIAYNTAMTRMKAVQKQRQQEEADDVLESIALEFNLQRQLEQQEVQTMVHQALSLLSPEHRVVVTLVEIDGLNCAEVADILDCPPGTVRSRLHYAKRKLFEVLLPHRGMLQGTDT